MSTFVALWPVTDDGVTLTDLKDEAYPELVAMLVAQRLTPAGRVAWSLTDHTESGTGLGLAATVEVTG